MRILAHVHSFNDADIIDRTIASMLRQTHPPDEVLLVDNASTDATLDRQFPPGVTVIRNKENLGTSGAVEIGFSYALEHGFDWIWVFDADSVPELNALEKLLELYNSFAPELQEQTAFVSCLPYNQVDGLPVYGSLLTPRGRVGVMPERGIRCHLFHVVIWSGALYRLAAVRRIGLPNPDYVLDWGEYEYGYHIMKAGFKGFIDHEAVMKHNIRGNQSLSPVEVKLGPKIIRFYDFKPIRCYYFCRNMLYFTLYETAEGRLSWLGSALWRVRGSRRHPGPGRGVVWSVLRFTLNFLVRPRHHGDQIAACLRGIWHGVTGNIAARF